MKTMLHYPGAKNKIAKWIVSNIPEHKVYLEPYGGSLAVLLNKPRCYIETVNDLDGDIVNLYRVLRDPEEAAELRRLIELTPYSRREYDSAYEDENAENRIEQARRFLVRCWMGFGNGGVYHNGFRSGQQSRSPNPAKQWIHLTESLAYVTERLRGVQIENLPAIELIRRYDTEDVFMYLDPPYLYGTRKSNLYRCEMSDPGEHEDLLQTVLQCPGKVLLSTYENDMYDDYLSGWNKVTKDTVAENGLRRTEVLYANYSLGGGTDVP